MVDLKYIFVVNIMRASLRIHAQTFGSHGLTQRLISQVVYVF